jgi:hypothetical protein
MSLLRASHFRSSERPAARLSIRERMRRDLASCLLKARSTITARHDPPAHARECSRLPCPFHQTCRPTCGHALRRKAASWKAPRFCCGTSSRIRIDWTCLVLTLLLKHSEMPGRARATTPGRQADPDPKQKSGCQKNQTDDREGWYLAARRSIPENRGHHRLMDVARRLIRVNGG